VAKSIVKSNIHFSQRPPWLKRIVKSGILFSQNAVAKSIVKSIKVNYIIGPNSAGKSNGSNYLITRDKANCLAIDGFTILARANY
jgi:hypothetical protein